MPTVAAALVASLAGWVVEGPARAVLGPGGSMAVGLLAATLVFVFAKRFFVDLRGD